MGTAQSSQYHDDGAGTAGHRALAACGSLKDTYQESERDEYNRNDGSNNGNHGKHQRRRSFDGGNPPSSAAAANSLHYQIDKSKLKSAMGSDFIRVGCASALPSQLTGSPESMDYYQNFNPSDSEREVNPTSALFARALVSEVTDNPRTMTPAAMAAREKQLLRAQQSQAARRRVEGNGTVMESMSDIVGQAMGGTGSVGDERLTRMAMTPIATPAKSHSLPPNPLSESRAQLASSRDDNYSSRNTVTIGLSLSRRHTNVGHPDTVTRQAAFDFNELQDRAYRYVSSTDASGWRAGGGESGAAAPMSSNNGDNDGFNPPDSPNSLPSMDKSDHQHNHKIAAPDTVHIPLITLECDNTFSSSSSTSNHSHSSNNDYFQKGVDAIISALARGEIFIPHMCIVPESLSVNGVSPPDLVVRFGCERNEDLPPDEWPNWCLEFVHNQIYDYFSGKTELGVNPLWTKRPFHITLAKKVRWKTMRHMNKYFAQCENVVNAWREKGPQCLDPQLSYIEGGATPEEVARPHGIYLIRNGRATNYFAPNLEPPYTTKMTRSLLMNVIGQSWDRKRRDWTSEAPARSVTAAGLIQNMCNCGAGNSIDITSDSPIKGVGRMGNGNRVMPIYQHGGSDSSFPGGEDVHRSNNHIHQQHNYTNNAGHVKNKKKASSSSGNSSNVSPKSQTSSAQSTEADASFVSGIDAKEQPQLERNNYHRYDQRASMGERDEEEEKKQQPSHYDGDEGTDRFDASSANSNNVINTARESRKKRGSSAAPSITSTAVTAMQSGDGNKLNKKVGQMGMERMVEENLSKSFGDSSEGNKNVGIGSPGKKKVLLSPPHTKGSEKKLSERQEWKRRKEQREQQILKQEQLEEQQKQQQKLLERQQQFQEEISSKASFASSSRKSSENNSSKTKKSNLRELNEVASKQKQQQQSKSSSPSSGRGVGSNQQRTSSSRPNPSPRSQASTGSGSSRGGNSNMNNKNSSINISPFPHDNSMMYESIPRSYSQMSMEYSVDTTRTGGTAFSFNDQNSVANQSLLSCVTRSTAGGGESISTNRSGSTKHQTQQQRIRQRMLGMSMDSEDDDRTAYTNGTGGTGGTSLGILQSASSIEIPSDEELYAVGWAKALDENSGSYYYFTLDRAKTVWENPLLNTGSSSGKRESVK